MSTVNLFAHQSSALSAAELPLIAHLPAASVENTYSLYENALEQSIIPPAAGYYGLSIAGHDAFTGTSHAIAALGRAAREDASRTALFRLGVVPVFFILGCDAAGMRDAGPSGSSPGLSKVEEIFVAGGLCLTGMLVLGVMIRFFIRDRGKQRHQELLNSTESEIEKERASRLQSAYDESPEDILVYGSSLLTIDYHRGLDDAKIREMMLALKPYLYDVDGNVRARAVLVLGKCVALLAPENRLDWVLTIEELCDDAYVPAQCAAITALGQTVPYLKPEDRQHPVMMLHMKSKTGNKKVRNAAARAVEALPDRMY